jgi:hypothetical protein
MQNRYSPSTVVVDVLPWPNGYGFAGADAWWQHSLNQSERERLDDLMGLALLDQDVRERLIVQHDTSLFDAFGLSEETRHWLASLRVNTLKEFAQAIVAASNPYRGRASSEAA